ncbi:beta strand repeat-containing protein [Planctomyces sp. SH-PL62]|uniref:beta strand repeat-containing protein n=1 Tax=Planctomyces sp. SH-PL62 TaxID=1636152 RepID=UPI00078B97A7|nr:Ig-like domain-containing protein [Planctomyces sp. SH-PL62]AMV40370.1 hypothetical protein VT85_23265 [Planctomyces sp. SH-PL62]
MIPTTTRTAGPRMLWGMWGKAEGPGRRKRRLRGETLRSLEGLEGRTMLAASINIDPVGVLTYDTDGATAETLTISVVGNIYTFASTETINVVSNSPGLPVTNDGTTTVTVQGILGLQVDANGQSDRITVASTNVATGVTLQNSDAVVTLGSAATPTGLGTLTAAITVSETGVVTGNAVVLDDTGMAFSIPTAYVLTATTVSRAGFGGLTYSGVDELTLKGASAGFGGQNSYTVSGTADDVATRLDDSANQGLGTYNVGGTSAVKNATTSLRLDAGGGAGDDVFNVAAASSAVDLWAGGGPTSLNLTDAGSASGVTGAVTLHNGAGAPFAVTVDHSAGTAGGAWKLGVASALARLTGFSAGGSLAYDPAEIQALTLRNAAGTANSLEVDFGPTNPLPAGSTTYDGGWTSSSGAKSDLILLGDPEAAIAYEIHSPSGTGAGLLQFVDEDSAATSISYSGLSPHSLYDTVPATTYTFNYLGDPNDGVRISDGENSAATGNVQTLKIASDGAIPAFVDTHVANKTNVVVNQNLAPGDYSITVDYAIAAPVAGLSTLTMASGSGDDDADLLALPAGAATVLLQGGGDDTASLALVGASAAASTSLDGGAGTDSLVVDAGGLAVTAANFAAGPGGATTITGAPITGGPITYRRYESVVVTDVGPITPTVYSVPIHAVQGQRLVDALVGAFTAPATARASDFVATIAWGDGSTSAGVIVQDASTPSIFYVYGTHTFYQDAPALATAITVRSLGSTSTTSIGGVPVTIIAPAGSPVTTAGTASVDNAPINVVVRGFSGFENIPIASSPSIVVATFTDLGGVAPTDANPAGNYTATIYWGDGSSGVGGLTIVRNGTSNSFIVTAAPHTYDTPRSYVVTVVVRDAETSAVVGIGSGSASIADAPLTATASQPTNTSILEGYRFVDWVVGSFNDANPLARTDQFAVTIDWGDGSPTSSSRVIQPGGVGTTFYVIGSHTYADALAPGAHPATVGAGPVFGPVTQDGVFLVTMTVRDTFGSAANLYNELTVADRLLTVSGALDSASDTGASNSDGVTSDSTPTFSGRASEGNAVVYLYGSPGGAPFLIGSTTADATGAWSITPAAALADGDYLIQAQAYDARGHTISALTVIQAVVVDTVGPKVADLLFDNFRGQVIATFQDFGGASNAGVGLNLATVRDANNYRFSALLASHPNLRRWLVTSIDVTPGTTVGEQVATVRFNDGAGIRGGRYLFTARSVDPSNLSGVQDNAGNALDGEFYGTFPSGNNVNGGDFEARLDAIHHTIFPARTQVGTATPVTPPGRPATGRFLRLDGTLLPSARTAVRLASARATPGAARLARLERLGS